MRSPEPLPQRDRDEHDEAPEAGPHADENRSEPKHHGPKRDVGEMRDRLPQR